MLSKTSIVILGLLCEEQLSAYDMLKQIELRNMKFWLPIGNTTLYEAVLRLEKKQYIRIEREEGKKSIYSITDLGRIQLQNTIETLFLRIDYDTIWFCLALMFCRELPDQKIQELIVKRKELLMEYQIGTKENIKRMEEKKLPFVRIGAAQRMLEVIHLELRTLEALENEVK